MQTCLVAIFLYTLEKIESTHITDYNVHTSGSCLYLTVLMHETEVEKETWVIRGMSGNFFVEKSYRVRSLLHA